ncbi:MAG: YXWGXW repeat-containing protein [Deltaproteobacteria bacterium]|nr:YXWGXW repeat-containing protein [Deltaproteobacteria bacterium]
MRLILILVLAFGFSASAFAQESAEGDDVRSADEMPEDMPDPPEDAPPAEAPPVDGTDDRPPHPETPEDLEELQPTAEMLAKTSYHWFPGHWIWTGEQFEWKSGEWVYKVKDMIALRPHRVGRTWLQTPNRLRRRPKQSLSRSRRPLPSTCIRASTLRR